MDCKATMTTTLWMNFVRFATLFHNLHSLNQQWRLTSTAGDRAVGPRRSSYEFNGKNSNWEKNRTHTHSPQLRLCRRTNCWVSTLWMNKNLLHREPKASIHSVSLWCRRRIGYRQFGFMSVSTSSTLPLSATTLNAQVDRCTLSHIQYVTYSHRPGKRININALAHAWEASVNNLDSDIKSFWKRSTKWIRNRTQWIGCAKFYAYAPLSSINTVRLIRKMSAAPWNRPKKNGKER